jgi:hypothetical protein
MEQALLKQKRKLEEITIQTKKKAKQDSSATTSASNFDQPTIQIDEGLKYSNGILLAMLNCQPNTPMRKTLSDELTRIIKHDEYQKTIKNEKKQRQKQQKAQKTEPYIDWKSLLADDFTDFLEPDLSTDKQTDIDVVTDFLEFELFMDKDTPEFASLFETTFNMAAPQETREETFERFFNKPVIGIQMDENGKEVDVMIESGVDSSGDVMWEWVDVPTDDELKYGKRIIGMDQEENGWINSITFEDGVDTDGSPIWVIENRGHYPGDVMLFQ